MVPTCLLNYYTFLLPCDDSYHKALAAEKDNMSVDKLIRRSLSHLSLGEALFEARLIDSVYRYLCAAAEF